MNREKLLQIGIGAAVAFAVIAPLGAFAYIRSGIYNVGASSPHTKLTEWITHETMIHSVRSHARDIVEPPSAEAMQVRQGFCEYETHCVACHGASAVPRERWVSGLEPAPPYLIDVTQRFRPRELFWIAKNGIKMTGMPSWRNSMSDQQIWDVVAFVEAMPEMNSQDYARWRAAGICVATSAQPSPGSSPIPRP